LLGAGTANVVAHVTLLAAKLLKGTAELGAAKTPADSVGPLVVLKAHDSDALVKVFAENGFVVSNRLDGLRISFHRYNSLEEVRALLELLDKNVDRPVASKQLCTAASKQ
jgi:selenocysteine lyase/cysteine desulfurase